MIDGINLFITTNKMWQGRRLTEEEELELVLKLSMQESNNKPIQIDPKSKGNEGMKAVRIKSIKNLGQ